MRLSVRARVPQSDPQEAGIGDLAGTDPMVLSDFSVRQFGDVDRVFDLLIRRREFHAAMLAGG
jgi:hypothetical protein